MAFFALFGVAFLAICFPTFRCGLFNLHFVAGYSVKDIYYYFKHKEYNKCPYGYIQALCADKSISFGCGKTLMSTHKIVDLYRRYNGLEVWCDERKKFVRQRILVLSNYHFKTIPYVPFESLQQYSDIAANVVAYDEEHDTFTVCLAVCDEAGSQMNSRDFKSNFDPRFIQDILSLRHFHSAFFVTSQAFDMIDKLLRTVVNTVITCDKLWRFQRYCVYSARELENATNPDMIKPIKRGCWFIHDKDYNAYDTHERINTLIKAYKNNRMASPEEVLAALGDTGSDVAAVQNFNRKYLRRHKRIN